MQNRVTFVSALAVIVPVLLVLIVVVVLARPSGDAQPAQSAPVPTSASAAQSAAQVPANVAPKPRLSGPAAPGFDGGGRSTRIRGW